MARCFTLYLNEQADMTGKRPARYFWLYNDMKEVTTMYYRLTHLFQKGKEENDRPLDESEVAMGLERRKKFLRYLNRGWLVLGIVTLATLPFFPRLRGEFIFLIAVTFPAYLIVRFLNLSGRTRLAGVVFTLSVNFSFYGLFMMLVDQLGANRAFETEATVWMLMGLAILFAGAFVDKWAGLGLAAFNTFLLIGTRLLIAPGSDPRPSVIVLWWMLALTSWLYEHTLNQALAQVLSELRERKQADDEIRRRVETTTALYETTSDLVIERDLSKLLQTIVERATRLLNAAGGGLYLCEPELGQVRCVVSYNTPRDFTGTVLKYGEGAAGRVAQTTEPLIINDYNTWEGRAKIYEKERPFSAVLSVPMKWQNEVIGVIHVLESQKEHLFTEDDLNLITSFANQAAIAVQNTRMYSLAQQELAERKEAESALVESEQRFRGLSEAAFEGILIHDEGIIQDANQVFVDLVGYRAPEDLIGKNGLETLPFTPESLERLRRNLSSGLTEPLEITVIRPDGSTFLAETQGRDITFKGRKLRVVAMRDITERKQVEDALYESRAQLAGIIESAMDGIITIDSEQRILLFNVASERIFGCSASEAVGEPIDRFIPAQFHDTHREHICRSGKTGVTNRNKGTSSVLTGLHANGKEFPIEASISQIEVKGQKLYTVILRDITEHKQAEEKLLASEVRYRRLFEAAKDGILILDADTGEIEDVNPFLKEMLGYSHTDFLGMQLWEIGLFKDIVANKASFHELQRSRYVRYENLPLETKDGRTIWVEFVSNVYDVNGKQVIQCNIRDITARKQVEGERENLIAELTAKNAELERFTYTVSHDLKSPLVTIKGFLGYIEQDMITGNVERLKDDTQRIANAVDKMAQLLNDLLELSRIGRMMNVSDVIAFDELVSEAMNIVHGQLEAHDVTVRSQPNLPAVYGDKPRLIEVLQNLLDNAVKNMGDQKKPIIEIGMAEYDESGNSVFFVRDNGIGIAPEYHERVFGLFNKLDVRSEGTGIGLALVKRIIEFHGGRIWVESKLGQGSTFLFTLPSQPKPDSVI